MADTSSNSISLPINNIQPNPFQPRGKVKPEEIEELKNSIKIYGMLEPIVVALTPAGYQIIAGERRWRAAKQLGLTEVPVLVKKTTPKGMLEMAIVENVQRVDLTPIERAQAFQQLLQEHGLNHQEIAERIGKSTSYISNSIRLLDLPDAIKDGLVGRQISEGHARAISGIENEKKMVECYKQILRESASVRRAEELAREYKEAIGQGLPKNTPRPPRKPNAEIEQWVDSLEEAFDYAAVVKLTRSSKQTRLVITIEGNVKETQKQLEKILSIANGKSKK